MKHQRALVQKGINYDTGTNFSPDSLSREWRKRLMEQEIRLICEQLHCTSIQIYGTNVDRLIACAKIALENGLHVWLQPRLLEGNQEETLAHLSEVALAAEQLRKKYQRIDLSLGCELSIFSSGLMPGNNYAERAEKLRTMWWLLPWFNKKLNGYLSKASKIVREKFKGKISYGAALWERVDWKAFDVVGLNLYKVPYNESRYVKTLRKFHRKNKPIVIFEFGCGTFENADKKGPESHEIIDWNTTVPEIKDGIKRNESSQANYIIELLNIYQSENIYGAFVYDFIQPYHPHSSNTRHDLDMASYGIVKVYSEDSEKPYSSGYWEPKEAFHEIAKFYRTNE
ncbi:abortive phage infection protein [Salicibibacter cibarius]|uniref:Abortive phage infection protein n=1 Tax=Salicibibacter cibarius TaxID=2743000 RepID=A0A7T6Z3L8_9BACI|nr:hypothetical protein [Salicibibacter cibarius]QQK76261.1 abortive phage infection protein [Salicibibacter cibarius]